MTRDKGRVSKVILGISLRMLINIALVFILVEGFATSYWFAYTLFADLPCEAASHENVNITVEEGKDVKEIASALELCNVVSNRYLFIARAYLGGYQDEMKAGTYTLSPAMTPEEVCKILSGKQSEDAT